MKPPIQRADPAHLGERLVIFGDRVELHDRNDRVRQVIPGDDIVDVVVHKRFTGATVTVESIDGTSIVAKGLSPDKAEKVREIIQRRTRQVTRADPHRPRPTKEAGPAAPGARPQPPATQQATGPARPQRPEPEPTPAPAPSTTVAHASREFDAADLLSKLVDLHQAGVLTDAELAEKKGIIMRLAAGEPLAATQIP